MKGGAPLCPQNGPEGDKKKTLCLGIMGRVRLSAETERLRAKAIACWQSLKMAVFKGNICDETLINVVNQNTVYKNGRWYSTTITNPQNNHCTLKVSIHFYFICFFQYRIKFQLYCCSIYYCPSHRHRNPPESSEWFPSGCLPPSFWQKLMQ